MYKYIVLDFGGVIVTSPTNHWDMTPKFLELIDVSKLDVNKFNEIRKKYGYILSEKVLSLEEEYDMFKRFYGGILGELGYNNDIIDKIAYDRTYNHSKYKLCDNIHDELSKLAEKYKLILLTDNWPCVNSYLKEYDLDKYFDKVYVSSLYGVEKKDGLFFDYPIVDYNIKGGEALFIDDNEINLSVAKTKGFDILLMDRDNKVENSEYEIIHDLYNIK